MRRNPDDDRGTGWRAPLADQLIAVCDYRAHIIRANLPAYRVVQALAAESVENLLPSGHPSLIAKCVATGKSGVQSAIFGPSHFQWSYRRKARRRLIYLNGRYLGPQSTELPTEAATLKRVLDQFAFGVLVIDTHFDIRYANPVAKALLERAWPGATREGRLFDSMIFLRQQLERLMARGGGAVTFARGTAHSPLEMLITFLGDERAGRATSAGSALICMVDPDSAPPSFVDRLQQLYRVTPAEARVAVALRQGTRLADGAQALGVKQTTVHSHVKALCLKLGAGRKAELLWRLNVCVASLIIATDWLSNLQDIL